MSEERELTQKQKQFCLNYVSEQFFGNGTKSYISAYQLDMTKPGAYASARSQASENLTKPNILKFINELLDSEGLNDVFVDKQLLFLITQNADLSAKVQSIREYNKLRQRIIDKSESKQNLTITDLSKYSYEQLKELAGTNPEGSTPGDQPT